LTENSGSADLMAFAGCRAGCFGKYFGEFLGAYSPHSKRSAVKLSDLYSPRVVCEDSDEFDRASRQCYVRTLVPNFPRVILMALSSLM
jgi:hypothetical protein